MVRFKHSPRQAAALQMTEQLLFLTRQGGASLRKKDKNYRTKNKITVLQAYAPREPPEMEAAEVTEGIPGGFELQIKVFDVSVISQGSFLYARHRTWSRGKGGIVSSVSEGELVIRYYPEIRTITNHYRIPVKEAADGEWEIRYTSDLKEIYEIPMKGETR